MPVKISRILHAGYLFESETTKIAFDPLFENPFSRNCFAFPAVEFDEVKIKQLQLDAIFISHYHDDHCSFDSLNLLDRTIPIYIYCIFEELLFLLRQLGFKNVYSLSLNITVQIGDFKITPRRALDVDVDSIFHIQSENVNILNVVDSWIDDETFFRLQETNWDMILWPFQTMRELEVLSPSRAEVANRDLPPEWVKQIKILKPSVIVPSSCQFQMESWSWYNNFYFPITYKKFFETMALVVPETQVQRINPGQTFVLHKNSLNVDITAGISLDWILPISIQNVEYTFDEKSPIPTTSEVAKYFKINVDQLGVVQKFCEVEILKRLKSLNFNEGYFSQKKRHWKLSIFDGDGAEQFYIYEIAKDFVCKSEINTSDKISWQTEIPAARLYSALVNGESLSSLYLRINDKKFCIDIENELLNVDLMEDPLARSLYENRFASYQVSQLSRINQRSQRTPFY